MPFLLIILGVNATLAITRIFTGDTFHMDAIIIANVIGSLFAFMVYNVQRAQVLDKDYAEQRIQLEKIKNDQLQTELKFLKSNIILTSCLRRSIPFISRLMKVTRRLVAR